MRGHILCMDIGQSKSSSMSEEIGREARTHEFEFDKGDEVLVRVREHGTSGNIVAKFTATCDSIYSTPFGGSKAKFKLPGAMNYLSYAEYEAEFEVVE